VHAATSPTITRVLVLRHGESEWNVAGRWQGRADVPLTERGHRQALLAAERLDPVDAIIASTLQRASRTAELIGAALGATTPVLDARLVETDVGPWEGLTRDDIDAQWPGYLDSMRVPDGFEPSHSVVGRVHESFVDLARRHPGSTLLVISHSGVIRTLRRHHGVADKRLHNLEGCWFDVSAAGVHSVGSFVSPLATTGDATESL
jgi:probable phosphoglycerate mutase